MRSVLGCHSAVLFSSFFIHSLFERNETEVHVHSVLGF